MFQPPSQFMKDSLEALTKEYESKMNGSNIQSYLLDRGITNETQTHFRLGAVVNPSNDDQKQYEDRLAIPYVTPSGVTSIRYRVVPPRESKQKYLGLPGLTSVKLFNVRALNTIDRIFICEGEIDTMTAHQAGLAAVGVAGVSNWNKDWWRIFQNRRVTVLADNDDKGQGVQFAEEIVSSLKDSDYIKMPAGHDVNSLVCSEGEQALHNLIEEKDKK